MALYKIRKILIAIIIVLFLFGCSGKNQIQNTKEMEIPENSVKEYFAVYQLGGTTSFDHFITGNPIDEDYEYDFTVKATTTAEMVAVQTKYAQIWQDEYNFANENLRNVLNQTDQSAFRNLQNTWEKDMKKRISFEQDLINDTGIWLGTAYQYLKISAYREEYRKRTLQTKYLHYLMESKGEEITDNNSFVSLKWKYKG